MFIISNQHVDIFTSPYTLTVREINPSMTYSEYSFYGINTQRIQLKLIRIDDKSNFFARSLSIQLKLKIPYITIDPLLSTTHLGLNV